MGSRASITSIHSQPAPSGSAFAVAASGSTPHPEPRLVGFSPLIAIAATNLKSNDDIDYEHDLQLSYTCDASQPPGFQCNALNPPASQNYVIGILDSGAVVDLIAGSASDILGVTGEYLTPNTIPIGGVGGTVNAFVSQPIGYYAAGLSAVSAGSVLDTTKLVGHSNTSIVVAPPIDCGNGESVIAVVGTPFMSFYSSIVSVDTPRRVTLDGVTYKSPDVVISDALVDVEPYTHALNIEFGGFSPVTTASYYPVLDPEDLITPMLPTQLSLSPLSLPLGGVFFASLQVREGPADINNPIQTIRVMVDTGAQSSIISPGVAATLNLPFTPDFTVDVCGVGGFVSEQPAYYLDYVRMNALGGALEFSNAPFVVLDLQSPEGDSLDGVLGMNFFWNRNIAFEPSLTTSGFVFISDAIEVARCDFDVDHRVDWDDAFLLSACESGAGIAPSPECIPMDVDANGWVGLSDFAWLQNCFSGSSAADLQCGP